MINQLSYIGSLQREWPLRPPQTAVNEALPGPKEMMSRRTALLSATTLFCHKQEAELWGETYSGPHIFCQRSKNGTILIIPVGQEQASFSHPVPWIWANTFLATWLHNPTKSSLYTLQPWRWRQHVSPTTMASAYNTTWCHNHNQNLNNHQSKNLKTYYILYKRASVHKLPFNLGATFKY
jgi:hypothetical protein